MPQTVVLYIFWGVGFFPFITTAEDRQEIGRERGDDMELRGPVSNPGCHGKDANVSQLASQRLYWAMNMSVNRWIRNCGSFLPLRWTFSTTTHDQNLFMQQQQNNSSIQKCCFQENACMSKRGRWHPLAYCYGLKYPHILSIAESKSLSNQNPSCVILLTLYGREIKTDTKNKPKCHSTFLPMTRTRETFLLNSLHFTSLMSQPAQKAWACVP